MKKITIIIVLIIFFKDSFAASMELEEGIISFTVNKSITEEGLPAYFDKDGMPMIEVGELFQTLEINSYTIEEDRVSFQLNGDTTSREIKIIKSEGRSLILYSTIEDIFKETQVEWDFNSMVLHVETREKLPKEFLEAQEEKRKKLRERREDKVIKEEWKGFTPGILYLGYNKSDLGESYDSINMNYINQILYGNLNLNTSFYDGDFDVDNFSWEREIENGRKIALGDVYTTTPFNIGDSGSFRGISLLGENSWDTSLDVSSKNIRGYAPNGATVELYENGILKDYQIVRNGEFHFEIKTTGGARTYEIWTYKPDGSIEKQPVAIYGTTRLVEKGKFDYEIQLGVDREYSDYNPYNVNVSYGLTDDLTFKVGSYNSRHESEEREYINVSPTYRIGSNGRWSHTIFGDLSVNSSDMGEKFYKTELQSGNGHFYNTFGFENYKNLDLRFLNENYDEKFYWRNSFSLCGINTSLSYEREKNDSKSEDIDRYGLTLYDSFFRGRITASMDIEREKTQHSSYSTTNDNFGIAITYNIQSRNIKKYINSVGVDYEKERGQ